MLKTGSKFVSFVQDSEEYCVPSNKHPGRLFLNFGTLKGRSFERGHSFDFLMFSSGNCHEMVIKSMLSKFCCVI